MATETPICCVGADGMIWVSVSGDCELMAFAFPTAGLIVLSELSCNGADDCCGGDGFGFNSAEGLLISATGAVAVAMALFSNSAVAQKCKARRSRWVLSQVSWIPMRLTAVKLSKSQSALGSRCKEVDDYCVSSGCTGAGHGSDGNWVYRRWRL